MFRIIIKMTLLILSLQTTIVAKDIVLSAKIKYENKSNHDIANIIHRVTIPMETSYQKLRSIKTKHIQNYKIKTHKHGQGKYLEFSMKLPKKSKIEKRIDFILQYNLKNYNLQRLTPSNKNKIYLLPSNNIESDANEIINITSKIKKRNKTYVNNLKAIFEFPAKNLTYKVQPTSSALNALKTRIGDCTEYSLLFVALARASNIPSRQASVFNFSKRNNFKMPNHHIAEIFTDEYGWLPVYPNLSHGKHNNKFSLGMISDKLIMYKYSGWTWSNKFPKGLKKYILRSIKTQTSWEIR